MTAENIEDSKGALSDSMGDTVQVNSNQGSLNIQVPVPLTKSRADFVPELKLVCGGTGNSPYGMCWDIPVSKISRSTKNHFPLYHDGDDDFLLAGVGELIPVRENGGANLPKFVQDGKFRVKRYRPRRESRFFRIEQWINQNNGDVHWRTTSGDGITSVYGLSKSGRIADPSDSTRIFEWLLEKKFDDKGNCQVYRYKEEDLSGVDPYLSASQNRMSEGSFTGCYLKQINYGNSDPCDLDSGDLPESNRWYFTVIFDFGEHDYTHPKVTEENPWKLRPDPFSSYTSGFEIRYNRLCERILLFHNFDELGPTPCIVSSFNMEHDVRDVRAKAGVSISSVYRTGYKKGKEAQLLSEDVPPLHFTYTHATPDDEIHVLDQHSNASGGQAVDLYGEGVNGILHKAGDKWFYKENKGYGQYGDFQAVDAKPAASASFSLNDLDGDGRPDLVDVSGQFPGYHELNKSYQGWDSFHPLKKSAKPGESFRSVFRMDYTGDGLGDLSVSEDGGLSYFASEGKDGFSKSKRVTLPTDLNTGPPKAQSDPAQGIFIANLSGSGQDIIRIKNGQISYWPSLGYGRFGRQVKMDNPPRIDHFDVFDPARLRFVDLTGSGTADLLYLGTKKVTYWINESGNSFSESCDLPAFPRVNSSTDIQVMDLLGEGTPCLVWSSSLPGDSLSAVRYIRLIGKTPSFLVSSYENNMGKETTFTYKSSADFYLKDKAEGRPWKTRISSHKPVVERIEFMDHVTGSRMHTRYRYHDGYFDGEEQAFRGFSFVEQFDTEHFKVYEGLDADDYVAPVCIKTWFHNGSSDSVLNHPDNHYQADAGAPVPLRSRLEDDNDHSPEIRDEALKVLAGQMVRQEVYHGDGSPGSEHPVSVDETAWHIRCLQQPEDSSHGVFHFYKAEALSHRYEQNPDDPKVSHQLVLETDDYGNQKRTCELSYPRRENGDRLKEQEELHAVVTDYGYLNIDGAYYKHGLKSEAIAYELGGLDPGNKNIFSWKYLRKQVNEALQAPLEFNDSLQDVDSPSARRINWVKYYYHDLSGNATVEPAELSQPARLHHSEQAVFDTSTAVDLFGEVADATLIQNLELQSRDNYWWMPSSVEKYADAGRFYLKEETVDPFGGAEKIGYDSCLLTATKVTDARGNTTEIETDYNAFQPARIKDLNENITEFYYGPLKNIVATTVYGESVDGNGVVIPEGDQPMDVYDPVLATPARLLDDIISDPSKYLQGTSSFNSQDLFAWKRSRDEGASSSDAAPVCSVGIQRETHSKDLVDGEASRFIITVSYIDGFSRHVQTKRIAEKGPAFVRERDGTVSEQENVQQRWLTTGGVVYNNKGLPVKQYEPLFSASPSFEPDDTFMRHGVTSVLHYDPAGRHVKTDTPKGFFIKKIFTPWEVRTYDENDTVKDSFYYESQVLTGIVDEAEKDAIDKAAVHAETPKVVFLDPSGRPVIQREYSDPDTPLDTHTLFDITGNRLRIEDARQRIMNRSRSDSGQIATFESRFDMLGRTLLSKSIDGGTRRSLPDAMGRPAHYWIANYHTEVIYNPLSRPTEMRVTDENGLLRTTEKFRYGDDLPDVSEAKQKNLLGQLIEHRDQAGIVSYSGYDIKGHPMKATRTLRSDYKGEVDWNEAVAMDEEVYTTTSRNDAIGRVVEKKLADGSIHSPEYLLSGQMKRVHVRSGEGNVDQYFIEDTNYNARGQRTDIRYGNGVRSTLTYEEATRCMTSLLSRRNGQTLQDIRYTYDPAGNMTRKDDRTREHILHNLPSTQTGQLRYSDFTYDALYRLTKATGWTHKALQQTDYAGRGLPSDAFYGTRHLNLNNGNDLTRYTRSYAYDEAGNMKQMKHTGDSSWTRNMWISELSNRSLPENQFNGNPEDAFDAAGNLKKLGHLDGPLHWNYRNELVQATVIARTDAADDAEYYVYDSDGMRVRKVEERIDNGHVIKMEKIYLDGCEIRREHRGEQVILERKTTFVEVDGQKAAFIHHWTIDEQGRETDRPGSCAIHYQLSDHLGSFPVELDEEGKLISYEEYFPYGGSAFIAGDNVKEVGRKEYRYSGKERDDATGLYYYGFRYYAPWMARWLKPDPAGPVDGLNLYAFVRGNPIRYWDRLGHFSEEELNELHDWYTEHGRYNGSGVTYEDGNVYHYAEHPDIGHFKVHKGTYDPDSGNLGDLSISRYSDGEWIGGITIEPATREYSFEAMEIEGEFAANKVEVEPTVEEDPGDQDSNDYVEDDLDEISFEDDTTPENGEDGMESEDPIRSEEEVNNVEEQTNQNSQPDKNSREATDNIGDVLKTLSIQSGVLGVVEEIERETLNEISNELRQGMEERTEVKSALRDEEISRDQARNNQAEAKRNNQQAMDRHQQAQSRVSNTRVELENARQQAWNRYKAFNNLIDAAFEGDTESFNRAIDSYDLHNEGYEKGNHFNSDTAHQDAKLELSRAENNLQSSQAILEESQQNTRAAEARVDSANRSLSQSDASVSRIQDRWNEALKRTQLNFGDGRAARILEGAAPVIRGAATVLGPVGTALSINALLNAETGSEIAQASLDLVVDGVGYIPHPVTLTFGLSYSGTQLLDAATGHKISSGAGDLMYKIDGGRFGRWILGID